MPKVFLIGAGPGDPGLITVRGKEILQQAEVVVYDYLADPALLTYAKSDAERIYVGKKAACHALPQYEINQLLIDKAREGKSVARLKGGDPYIFGRGGEEAEALVNAGIEFEEVPGVSSAIAGPAYAGIPLTHRDFTSSVTFITGHERPDKAKSVHNWQALAASANTLVFVMGMKNLPVISKNLIHAGLSPDTPVALIYWGTTPRHRSIVSTLAKLPEESAGFTNPSLIVVGKVVTLHDRLNWFEKRPLFGKTVVVTRAREQASILVRDLENLGAEVIQFPTIAIQASLNFNEKTLYEIGTYTWVIFTSANGVDIFWDRLGSAGLDARTFCHTKVAAIGPATAGALQKYGIKADFLPESFIAESVAHGLLEKIGYPIGCRILIPRACKARESLPEILTAAGAIVHVLPLYETVPAHNNKDTLLTALEEDRVFCITFTSSSTVDHFFSTITPEILKHYPDVKFACIGPITARTLEQYGFTSNIMPETYTIPALVDAIAKT